MHRTMSTSPASALLIWRAQSGQTRPEPWALHRGARLSQLWGCMVSSITPPIRVPADQDLHQGQFTQRNGHLRVNLMTNHRLLDEFDFYLQSTSTGTLKVGGWSSPAGLSCS